MDWVNFKDDFADAHNMVSDPGVFSDDQQAALKAMLRRIESAVEDVIDQLDDRNH